MGNCCGHQLDVIENVVINKRVRLCQKCEKKAADYVRKFDFEKVPREYIINPENVVYWLLVKEYKENGPSGWMNENKYLVNLPKEFVLTKYNYYLCTDCYKIPTNKITCEWNFWEKYSS